MAKTERIAGRLIQRVPLFFGFTSGEMKHFLDICKLELPDGGTVLCDYNGASTSLYILLDGELEILGPGEVLLARIAAVNVVGEMGFISRKPRSATVRCRSASRLLRVDYHDFQPFAERYPDTRAKLYRNMIRILADRLSNANDLVVRYRKLYESGEGAAAAARAGPPTGTDTARQAPKQQAEAEICPESEAATEAQLLSDFYMLASLDPPEELRQADQETVAELRRAGYSSADIEYAYKWAVRNLPAVKRFSLVKLSIDEAFADRWST